jgi:PAS domain S-box-containing protein
METGRRGPEGDQPYEDVKELLRRLAAADQSIQEFEARLEGPPAAPDSPALDASWTESEARFHLLAESAPIFIWIADEAGSMLYLNRPWQEFTGRPFGEARGQAWLSDVHPDDRPRWHEAYRAAGEARSELGLELRLRRADGQFRWLMVSGVPRISGGAWTGFIGTAFDQSERRRAEGALRSSRDQLAVILKGVADGITAQAPDGRLIYANQAAARLMGYSSPEAMLAASPADVGRRVKLYDESGRALSFDSLPGSLALRDSGTQAATVRYLLTDNGEERWAFVRAAPIFDADGRIEMVVNLFHDVTELKRAEIAQRLLAEASRLLADPLSYHERLAAFARLMVPVVADLCFVHLLADGQAVLAAVAHSDEATAVEASALRQAAPAACDEALGAARALRTGQTTHHKDYADAGETARDAAGRQFVQALGLQSGISVPLVARQRTLGAITCVWAESDGRYGPAEIRLAEDLAQRLALAIDNAQLFETERQVRESAEGFAHRTLPPTGRRGCRLLRRFCRRRSRPNRWLRSRCGRARR